MPLYINAEQAARYFASLRKKLPHDARDFMTRDSLLLSVELALRSDYSQLAFWDAIQIGDCADCVGQEVPQNCSCCRRNRHLKDNYKEA
jgi:hypothetical protein